MLQGIREGKGVGVTSYRADRNGFIGDLLSAGLLEAMAEEANRRPHWSDTLVERLRSGRGSAISGQKRGRDVEDFAEANTGGITRIYTFEMAEQFEADLRQLKAEYKL